MQPADIDAARAFATIGIIAHPASLEAQLVNGKLNHVLQSRFVIEQAKGMVAERETVDLDIAFEMLRRHARNHNLRLADVARDIITGTLAAAQLE